MSAGLPKEIESGIKTTFEKKGIRLTTQLQFSGSTGGCINEGGVIKTSVGPFFVKWNSRNKFPGMFAAESTGLKLLSKSRGLHIPEVIAVGEVGAFQFLILSHIESAKKNEFYWEELGEGLADLHRITSPSYGLDHNNFIGSLDQENTPSTSWIQFFIHQRLEKQLKLMEHNGYEGNNLRSRMERFYNKLPDLLCEEKPALLHGDLWSGNIMSNQFGKPCLIDPAVYFGHREVDLAMTRLFGGFAAEFYSSYRNAYPLENGFEDRLKIYTLYPLMVHVNLFGSSYLSQVNNILDRFS
jgi:protein-ribulosamine 3-kinase